MVSKCFSKTQDMKTKLKTRALVVETRNREVTGGSLWAGRLLRQALSFYGGVIMRGKTYLNWMGKFTLDVLADAGKLPKEQKALYFAAIKAGLKAISQGRIDCINKAIKVLEE